MKKTTALIIFSLLMLLVGAALFWLAFSKSEAKKNNNDFLVSEPYDQVLADVLRISCEQQDGLWLQDSASYECEIDGQVYARGIWELLPKMAASCEEAGGDFLAGSSFSCEISGNIYENNSWARLAAVPTIAERCVTDGGDWLEESNTCRGLPVEWCIDIEQDLEEIRGLNWDRTTLSCSVNID